MPRRGFTLLELVITLVLIGIAATAAIVGFSSVISKSRQATADSTIDVVRVAEVRFGSVYGLFTPWPDDLRDLPSDVTAVAGPATAVGQVSIAVGVDGSLGLATLDEDGACRAARIPQYGAAGVAEALDLPDTMPCDARSALPEGEAARPVESAAW